MAVLHDWTFAQAWVVDWVLQATSPTCRPQTRGEAHGGGPPADDEDEDADEGEQEEKPWRAKPGRPTFNGRRAVKYWNDRLTRSSSVMDRSMCGINVAPSTGDNQPRRQVVLPVITTDWVFADRVQRPRPSMPVSGRLLITARARDIIVGRPEHANTIKQVGGSSGRICESNGVNQITWLKQLADHQGRAAADESHVIHGKSPLSVLTPHVGRFTASSAASVSPMERPRARSSTSSSSNLATHERAHPAG